MRDFRTLRAPAEVAQRIKAITSQDWDRSKPNRAHMNALLDAVESGNPRKWRQHPISVEEIRAAYWATGRKPKPERQPGDDEAEDAFR